MHQRAEIGVAGTVFGRGGKQKDDCHRMATSLYVHVDIFSGIAEDVVNGQSFGYGAAVAVYIEFDVFFAGIVAEYALYHIGGKDAVVHAPGGQPYLFRFVRYVVIYLNFQHLLPFFGKVGNLYALNGFLCLKQCPFFAD